MSDESNAVALHAIEDNTDGQEGIASGLVLELGSLPEGSLVTEARLAHWFGRHPASIRRAVERGELPPPTKLLGKPVWTVGCIRRHVEARLDQAEADQRVFEERISKHLI